MANERVSTHKAIYIMPHLSTDIWNLASLEINTIHLSHPSPPYPPLFPAFSPCNAAVTTCLALLEPFPRVVLSWEVVDSTCMGLKYRRILMVDVPTVNDTNACIGNGSCVNVFLQFKSIDCKLRKKTHNSQLIDTGN